MVGHSTHKEKEVPFVNIANLSLYYDETGKGYPIVLIHGGFSDITEWNPQRDVLGQHYRVIRYDRRGCGHSVPKNVPQLSDLWVEDLREFMFSLGLEKAYMGGVSYGGMLLIEFLIKYQSMCKAAIIVSATGRGMQKTSQNGMYFPNRLSELSTITIPTLVVQATEDHIFPPEHGEEISQNIPGSELVVLNGGHTINNDCYATFNKAVLDFLGRVDLQT